MPGPTPASAFSGASRMLNFRHPWQVIVTVIATFIAAGLQLTIPRLLGRAVDQAHGVGVARLGRRAGALGDRAHPSRRQRRPRRLHADPELLFGSSRPPRRLRAPPRLLRKAPAPELLVPRQGPLRRSDHARHHRHRWHPHVLRDGDGSRVPPRRAARSRRLPPDLDRPRPRASRAELRALRRLALVGIAAQVARHLAGPPGEAAAALAGDGREPRRHPRRPRLRRPAPRAQQVRQGVEGCPRARPPAHEIPRRQRRRDELLVLCRRWGSFSGSAARR